MIGEEFVCAREECGKTAVRATHNQKYCTNECCRIETNRKIMEQYHERAAIRRGKPRSCKMCGTSLSRYNVNKVCSSCETKKRREKASEAQAILAAVSWL